MIVMAMVAQNGLWSMMEILLIVAMGTLDDPIQQLLGPIVDLCCVEMYRLETNSIYSAEMQRRNHVVS